MREELKRFIEEVSKHSDLADRKLPKIVAKYYDSIDMQSREAFYGDLHKYYALDTEDYEILREQVVFDQPEIVQNTSASDYRIHRILLSNLRGIPQKYNAKDYGISFESNNNRCQNMALLGMNGTGKSSIYDALEYMYCGEIGEAKIRHSDSFNDEEYKKYLVRGNDSFSNLSCRIETVDNSYDIHDGCVFTENELKKIVPESHFISEHNVIDMGRCHYGSEQQGRTIHKVIAEKLGLSDFIRFSKSVKDLVSYRRTTETSRLNKNKKELETLRKELDRSKEFLKEQNSKLLVLNGNNKNANTDDYQEIIRTLSELKAKKIEISFDVSDFEKTLMAYFDLMQKLKRYDKVDLDKELYGFLYQGLEMIKRETVTNCPFCGSSTLGVKEIAAKVEGKLKAHKEYTELINERTSMAERIVNTLRLVADDADRYLYMLDREDEQIGTQMILLPLADINHVLKSSFDSIKENQFLSSIHSRLINNGNIINEDLDTTNIKQNIIQMHELLKTTRKTIESREQLIQKIETDILAHASGENISVIEQQAIIKKEISELENRISIQKQQIEELQQQTPFLQRQVDIYNQIKNDVSAYAKVISREIDKKVTTAFEPIRDTVETILKEFSSGENYHVKVGKKPIEFDEESGEILAENIVVDLCNFQDEPWLSPNKYYNGFRYKIFCLSVCVSIAIAVRKKTRINLPVVMDDILTCADFDHRLQFESFFKRVVELFKKHSPEGMPLQLIYLTHDELMYDSVCRVMSKNDNETISARLLTADNAQEEEDYNELTYKIPDRNIRLIMDFYKEHRAQA